MAQFGRVCKPLLRAPAVLQRQSVIRTTNVLPLRGFTSTAPRLSDKSARDYLAAWVGRTPGDRYLKTIEERMRQTSQTAIATSRQMHGNDAKDAPKLFSIHTLALEWPANKTACVEKLQGLSLAVQQTMRDSGVLLEFETQPGASETVHEVQQSFNDYKHLLQEHQIRIIGVANCPTNLETPLKALGVAVMHEQQMVTSSNPSSANASRRSKAPEGSPSTALREERHAKRVASSPSAQFVHGTVRSGQQVYAEGRSLVILGGVNEGAEVMADGDIHVYGRLQGRAVAGLSGDRLAKIFTSNFDAPLVGISDIFKLSDEDPTLKSAKGKAVMIHIESEQKEGLRDPQPVLQVTAL